VQDYFDRMMTTREKRQSDFELFLDKRDNLPPSDYVHRKAEPDNIDYFRLDEIRKIVEGTDSLKYWLIYRMMFHSGRRPGEVALLRVENVNFTEGTITYPVLKKRFNDQIKIREPTDTLDKLKHWLDTQQIDSGYVFPSSSESGHLTTRAIRSHLDRKLKKLSIPKKERSPKSFRHSHVTWRLEDGESLEEISRTGTKNTISVLEKVYAGLTIDEQKEATMGTDLL
jgi:integrase